MTSNKYVRDFHDISKLLRPGRFDPRLLQATANAGDGYPGIQRMIHNILGKLLLPRFVIEGCSWSGGTLSAGYIMWSGSIVKVEQQAIALPSDQWLYIDSAGVAHATATEATAKAGVMIAQDIGGTPSDIRFRQVSNVLTAYALSIKDDVSIGQDLTVSGDLDVDGVSNLDNTDIDGTLDVSGVADFHENIDMNSKKLINLVAGTATGDSVRYDEFNTLEGTVTSHVSSDGSSHSFINQSVTTASSPLFNNVSLADDIIHSGDTDTLISFTTDAISFETGGTARIDISNTGVRFGATGARITEIENNDNLGTSDTKLCTQGNVKAYADAAVNAHATATGASHTYISQDVTSTGTPTFGSLTLNGNLDLNDNNIVDLDRINDAVYFVSTDAELDAAITAIGGGDGTIIITADLSNVQVDINNATANIIIQGVGLPTLDPNGDNDVINVTSCNSIIIRDLKFDLSEQTLNSRFAIDIQGANFSVVENVVVVSGGSFGSGVRSAVSYTKISNCNIQSVYSGIQIGGAHSVISGCYIYDCSSEGILVSSAADWSTITGCTIDLNSTSNTIEAINVSGCEHVTISGNVIRNAGAGILTNSTAHYLSVTGNIFDTNASGGGDSCEILGDGCAVVGNVFWDCTQAIIIDAVADHCIVSGNTIIGDASWSDTLNKIAIYMNGEYGSIVGNVITDYQNAGSGVGYGVWIGSGAVGVVVAGNNVTNTETEEQDDGSNTRDDTSNMTTGANLNYFG